MPYLEQRVEKFDKGLITEIAARSIPAGAASDALNFLDLGDRFELRRGVEIVGDRVTGTGNIDALTTVTAVDGTEQTYRRKGTKIQRLNGSDTWADVITLPVDESVSFTADRTPAGSFLWISSPNTGLYRINVANPDSYIDFYDAARNFKGYISVINNAMWLWGDTNSGTRVANDAVLRRSFLDNDWPYTAIAGEAYGTGNGVTKTFAHTAANVPLAGRTVSVTDGVETFTDDGSGVLTGSAGGTGTVNYTTGALSVTFFVAPLNLAAITTSYKYETPKTSGKADFTYSTPRLATEGTFFIQTRFSDTIKSVFNYDNTFYVPHSKTWWKIEISTDDLDATNDIYREFSGISSMNAAVSTGDGIFFIDDSDQNSKMIRLLRYNEIAAKVIPEPVTPQVNLNAYVFDECFGYAYGDFVIFACKSSDNVSYNDTLILYNRKWKLVSIVSGFFSALSTRANLLIGGSSVENNVYNVFTGFDDDGVEVVGQWTSNDWDLTSPQLKKLKRFVVEGEMAESQELIIDYSLDGGEWVEMGRIAGDSVYVDLGSATNYGRDLYGSQNFGNGATVSAYAYQREFRVRTGKFERIKVRFRTESFGYLNVRAYGFRDIRRALYRVPAKFRS